EDPRVGEGALQRPVLGSEGGGELLGCGVQGLDAARVEPFQRLLGADEPNARPSLGPLLGQDQAPGVEVDRGETHLLRDRRLGTLPTESPGDHQMDHQEQLVGELEDDPLSDPAQPGDLLTHRYVVGRVVGAEHGRRCDADAGHGQPEHPLLQGVDVDGDIGQLGHTRRLRPWTSPPWSGSGTGEYRRRRGGGASEASQKTTVDSLRSYGPRPLGTSCHSPTPLTASWGRNPLRQRRHLPPCFAWGTNPQKEAPPSGDGGVNRYQVPTTR